jgi:predicted dehydrogenase
MRAVVRIAFLGAGDISALHAAALRRIPNAELAGIWSLPGCAVVTDPAAVANRYGCKLYNTPEELVSDPSVDAVFILTNMESHAKLAIMAMDSKKHVLVEKPVASTVAELHAMKAASLRNGVALMPGHNYIYEPWFERTKALIDGGDLGRITACYVMYNIHHPETVTGRASMQGVIRQIFTHHA